MEQAEQQIREKGYAYPEMLVTTEWVAQHLEDTENVRIVESDEDVLLYDIGHIPNAVKMECCPCSYREVRRLLERVARLPSLKPLAAPALQRVKGPSQGCGLSQNRAAAERQPPSTFDLSLQRMRHNRPAKKKEGGSEASCMQD